MLLNYNKIISKKVPQEEFGKMRVKLQSNSFQTSAIPLTDGTFSL